jgi:hypothetical protein
VVTTVDDLITKLEAALGEEEQIAKAACHAGKGEWRLRYPNVDNPTDFGNSSIEDEGGSTVAHDEGAPTIEEAAHIVKQSPKRTLEKIAAVQELISKYEAVSAFYNARKEAPAGEVYGLYTAIILIAKGYGIDG